MDLYDLIHSIRGMLAIAMFEFFLVFIAMCIDFISGYNKAKQRGEERNSYGMRRTVSKFILYSGSICISCGIDVVCGVSHLWDFLGILKLVNIPVVTSVISIFILVTELRSVWEKADKKQRKRAAESAALVGTLFNKDILRDAFTEALISASKEKEERA